mgnify:FL=1
MARTVSISCEASGSPLAKKAASLLRREIAERSGVRIVAARDAECRLALATAAGIGEEGFRIEGDGVAGVRIDGNDGRGVIYGVGRFLRSSRFRKGEFLPGAWRGASVPRNRVRGM